MASNTFAEVIYETGSKSVMVYDTLDELKASLAEQNARAINGTPGGPTGHAAERVKRVLLFDAHPASYGADGQLPVEALIPLIPQSGNANGWDLISKIRGAMSPIRNNKDAAPHDSMFVMTPKGELSMDFLNTKVPAPDAPPAGTGV